MSVSGGAPPPSPHQLLVEEAAQLRGFLDLLSREQKSLADGDLERLLPLATEKNECFTRLSGLGEARGRALAAAGLAASRQGMETWLAQQPEAGKIRRDWQEFLDLAEQARTLNETNGKLIATRLSHNRQAFSTLMSAANQAALYGPDGQARPVGGGRSLGSV